MQGFVVPIVGASVVAKVLSVSYACALVPGQSPDRGLGVKLQPVGDGVSNGWQNHHTADLAISAGEIALGLFEATSRYWRKNEAKEKSESFFPQIGTSSAV